MANLIKWTQDDRSSLRDFLLKNPKFLRLLEKSLPRSEKALTRDEAANQGQQAEGYLKALDKIEELADDPKPGEVKPTHTPIGANDSQL